MPARISAVEQKKQSMLQRSCQESSTTRGRRRRRALARSLRRIAAFSCARRDAPRSRPRPDLTPRAPCPRAARIRPECAADDRTCSALWLTYAAPRPRSPSGSRAGIAGRFPRRAGSRSSRSCPSSSRARRCSCGSALRARRPLLRGDPWKQLAAARRGRRAAQPDPLGPRVREPARGAPRCARRSRTAAPRSGTASSSAARRCSARRRPASSTPSTWLGLWLPLRALLDVLVHVHALSGAPLGVPLLPRLRARRAGGARWARSAWGFSTYLVFWVGWSVGPSTATFPLLAARAAAPRARTRPGRPRADGGGAVPLALRRPPGVASFTRPRRGAAYFLVGALRAPAGGAASAIAGALGAGVLALLLCGPAALPAARGDPALRRVPRAATRRFEPAPRRQSVALSARPPPRLLPDLLPFAHGIYGKSAGPATARTARACRSATRARCCSRSRRSFLRRATRPRRGTDRVSRVLLAGLAYGASAPGLLDVTSRLPGFALALNYRLVFLAGLGLAGLAALGTEALSEPAPAAAGDRIGGAPEFLVGRPSSRWHAPCSRHEASTPVRPQRGARGDPAARGSGARRQRGAPPAAAVADAALACLVVQRFVEMGGIYPTLPAERARAAAADARRPASRQRAGPDRGDGGRVPPQCGGALPDRGRARLRIPDPRPFLGHVSALVAGAAGLLQPRG